MNVIIDLENASSVSDIPDSAAMSNWASAAQSAVHALGRPEKQARQHSLAIRVVDESESAQLNSMYRNKDAATDVLSFSSSLPAATLQELDEFPLGDLAICAPVVAREAKEQGKSAEEHWAHLVIHGVLHLNGFDHQVEADAEAMEALETGIMHKLGFADPYDGVH